MNVKEYQALIEYIDQQIEELKQKRTNAIKQFRKNCTHPVDKIIMSTNGYEDDYGRLITNKVDFNYKCNRCGAEVKCVRKQPSLKPIRVMLDEDTDKL